MIPRLRRPKTVLTVGGLLFVALWLPAHYRPFWYRPALLDEAESQRARRHAIATTDWVSARMVKKAPFELTLHAQTVNEWIAALPTLLPGVDDDLPSELTHAAVGFEENRIQFGVCWRWPWWQAIVSVQLTADLSDDGRFLRLRLGRLRGGALPFPRSAAVAVLGPVFRAVMGKADGPPAEGGPFVAPFDLLRSIDALFEGVQLENRFEWFNGERPFRLRSIKIDGGELRLWIEPL